MTDLGDCLSSHVMQLLSSSSKLLEEGGASLWRGPIGKNGTWSCCCRCVNEDCSRQSMVFQMMGEENFFLYILTSIWKKASKSPKREMGRSLNLRG